MSDLRASVGKLHSRFQYREMRDGMQSLLEICWLVVRGSLLAAIMESLIGDDSLTAGLRTLCILSVLSGMHAEVLDVLGLG